ncbi:hypothetical protein Bpfe_014989 [Biomphalaria pfeifferi]|uniref:G-protein coupled receptors family 1 profile domain-containing protein n=1 Tax=Biomphalaria pfeifferi TaxID=112525 RepID=A0AAD8BK48_BIOPF|nr:hypothetical protein Bpfe_014989 [Biomphalaria pfeifferi]
MEYRTYNGDSTNAALSVVFILLTVLVNGALLALHARRNGFYKNNKSMITISMAIGNLVLAMFPLIVLAKFYNEDDYLPSTSLQLRVATYSVMLHFINVHCLTLLGADVLIKKAVPEAFNKHKLALALLTCSLPWIFNICLVLPLYIDTDLLLSRFILLLVLFPFFTLTSLISNIVSVIMTKRMLGYRQGVIINLNENINQAGQLQYLNQQPLNGSQWSVSSYPNLSNVGLAESSANVSRRDDILTSQQTSNQHEHSNSTSMEPATQASQVSHANQQPMTPWALPNISNSTTLAPGILISQGYYQQPNPPTVAPISDNVEGSAPNLRHEIIQLVSSILHLLMVMPSLFITSYENAFFDCDNEICQAIMWLQFASSILIPIILLPTTYFENRRLKAFFF